MLASQLRLIALVVLGCAGTASAQLRDAPAGNRAAGAGAATEGEWTTIRFRVGAVITAKRGACRDVFAAVAVPIECAEQTVKLVEQDVTANVTATDFRDLSSGEARQLLISIPRLDAGAEARAILTYEVTTRTTLPPDEDEAARLVIPKRAPRKLRGYLGASKYIQVRHPMIKKLSRSIENGLNEAAPEDNPPSDWQRIEAVYDYVMDNIEYLEGPDTSAVDTLKAREADCHGRSALFVALCRAAGAPARMVWVNEHCHPEFYLERPDGEGVWLPAESAGTRAFGEMPIARPILQKGDNFRVPEKPRERLRYATDYLIARPAQRGGGKPTVKYLREIVP